MGNRLGLGTTKALIKIEGKTIIERHLELLKNEKDIRIVVGYQAERVIEVVNKIRRDIIFVFNHNFKETGTGDSVALASKYADEYILALDGDLLVHPLDMKNILEYEGEFVGGNFPDSDDPWYLKTYIEKNVEYVRAFSRDRGEYEWNGITQIKSVKMLNGTGHVFQLIEPHLPVKFMNIRTREIDTVNDYDRAVEWVKNGYK